MDFTGLDEIIGEQLSAVTFVQDYLQLHFDGPTLNVTSKLHVSSQGVRKEAGDLGFRDLLCSQITKEVVSIDYKKDESIQIQLSDGSIVISLKAGDFLNEAVYAHGLKDDGWFVLE